MSKIIDGRKNNVIVTEGMSEEARRIEQLEEQLEFARDRTREQYDRISELEAEVEKLKESDLEMAMIRRILGYYD